MIKKQHLWSCSINQNLDLVQMKNIIQINSVLLLHVLALLQQPKQTHSLTGFVSSARAKMTAREIFDEEGKARSAVCSSQQTRYVWNHLPHSSRPANQTQVQLCHSASYTVSFFTLIISIHLWPITRSDSQDGHLLPAKIYISLLQESPGRHSNSSSLTTLHYRLH